MNAQLLEDEGLGPDPPHRDRLRSKEELSQAEKVKLDPGSLGQGGAACPTTFSPLEPQMRGAAPSCVQPVLPQPPVPRENGSQRNLAVEAARI